jgi:hypothetical protein
MTEVFIIKLPADRYHVRLPSGQWHKYRSRQEAAELLWGANLNAFKYLQDARELPKTIDVTYSPQGRHRWFANGVPMSLKYVKSMLRENGCTKEAIETILQCEKLIWKIKQLLVTLD